MHFTALLYASLAAGAFASVSNPHHKIQHVAKRVPPVKREARPLVERSTSSYLTPATQSKFRLIAQEKDGTDKS